MAAASLVKVSSASFRSASKASDIAVSSVSAFFNFSRKNSAAEISARRFFSATDKALVIVLISATCNSPSFCNFAIKPSSASRFAADKRAFSSFSFISLRALINKSSIASFSLIVSRFFSSNFDLSSNNLAI